MKNEILERYENRIKSFKEKINERADEAMFEFRKTTESERLYKTYIFATYARPLASVLSWLLYYDIFIGSFNDSLINFTLWFVGLTALELTLSFAMHLYFKKYFYRKAHPEVGGGKATKYIAFLCLFASIIASVIGGVSQVYRNDYSYEKTDKKVREIAEKNENKWLNLIEKNNEQIINFQNNIGDLKTIALTSEAKRNIRLYQTSINNKTTENKELMAKIEMQNAESKELKQNILNENFNRLNISAIAFAILGIIAGLSVYFSNFLIHKYKYHLADDTKKNMSFFDTQEEILTDLKNENNDKKVVISGFSQVQETDFESILKNIDFDKIKNEKIVKKYPQIVKDLQLLQSGGQITVQKIADNSHVSRQTVYNVLKSL